MDLLTLKLVRIIARGIRNYLLILMFLGLFVLYLWATPVRRTTWHRDLNLWLCWWWSITAIRVFVLHLYTRFEVRRPFLSEDMTHFRSQHYVGLVTLTFAFDLETRAHYCPWGGQPVSYQFWCFYEVSFSTYLDLSANTLDWSRDLATLTFDLGGHNAWPDAGLRAPSVYQLSSS